IDVKANGIEPGTRDRYGQRQADIALAKNPDFRSPRNDLLVQDRDRTHPCASSQRNVESARVLEACPPSGSHSKVHFEKYCNCCNCVQSARRTDTKPIFGVEGIFNCKAQLPFRENSTSGYAAVARAGQE